METRDFARLLRRNWMIIVAVMATVIALAAGYTLTQEPQYEASAKVFVSTQSANSAAELTQGGTFTQQVVKSYADIVTTSTVLQPVIDDLDLDMTVSQLAAKVTASAPLNTVVLEISAVDGSPELAAQIANAVSQGLSEVVSEVTPTTAEQSSPVKITQVNIATVPNFPVSPRPSLNIGLGALAGLVLGLGLALLRSTFDVKVRGERDVELVTERPIIGGITFDREAKKRPLVVQTDPGSIRAESFRTLRTNLQFLDLGRGSRTLVITSSIESEGKSTTAANLAISIANTDLGVVLIDADLRRPRLADYLGVDGSVGLTDVLIGRVTLDEALQPWGEKNMFVLPAGQIPPNPSELLQSKEMVAVLSTLKKRFGTVILDAPPLLPVSDAAILSRRTDGAIVICAAGRTKRPQLKAALEVLSQVGGKALGVVITMLPTKGPDATGYGQYGYGHAYTSDVPTVTERVSHESPVPAPLPA